MFSFHGGRGEEEVVLVLVEVEKIVVRKIQHEADDGGKLKVLRAVGRCVCRELRVLERELVNGEVMMNYMV